MRRFNRFVTLVKSLCHATIIKYQCCHISDVAGRCQYRRFCHANTELFCISVVVHH
jgi:hypothetical protein